MVKNYISIKMISDPNTDSQQQAIKLGWEIANVAHQI